MDYMAQLLRIARRCIARGDEGAALERLDLAEERYRKFVREESDGPTQAHQA